MYLQVYIVFAYISILFMVDLKICNSDPLDYKAIFAFWSSTENTSQAFF